MYRYLLQSYCDSRTSQIYRKIQISGSQLGGGTHVSTVAWPALKSPHTSIS
jgi:hypothetical protein